MRSLLPLAALALAGCTPAEKAPMITVSEASVRASGDSAAAYATLVNSGGADRLVAVEAGTLGTASLHETSMDGGVMRMRQVDGIDVPAGGRVTLKSGGAHVMIAPLARPVTDGEQVPLTFRFARQGAVVVEATTATLGSAAHHGMDH